MTEVIGTDGTVSHSSLHGPKRDGQPYSITSQRQATEDLSAAFHVYAATWTPGGIDFAFDGKTFFTVSKQAVQAEGDWVFDQPFYLLLNVAVGGTWPGPPSAGTRWPQQMIVDYVRVYQDR